jgi:hypothetical protein
MRASRRWRSAMSNRPMAVRTNGNTKQGRRVGDLYRAFLARIGNPDDLVAQANCLAAAELTAACEACRSQVLADDAADDAADRLVRLENLARRAEAKLGKFVVEPDPVADLKAYLNRDRTKDVDE